MPVWQNPIPIELVPRAVNSTSNSTEIIFTTWITDALDGWTNVDTIDTGIAFITQTNTNPYVDYVGAWAYVPFVTTCDKHIHLSGAFGLGLEAGLYWAFWVTIAVAVILSFFIPWLGMTMFALVSVITLPVTFGYVTLSVAYNYHGSCVTSVGALAGIATGVPLPLLPGPLLNDTVALRDKYIQAAWHFIPQVGSEVGMPLEPTCPESRYFLNCSDELGVGGSLEWVGETLHTYLPRALMTTLYQLFGSFFAFFYLDTMLLDPLDSSNFTAAQNATLTECVERVGIVASIGPVLALLLVTILILYFLYSVLAGIVALTGLGAAISSILWSNELMGGTSTPGDVPGVTGEMAVQAAPPEVYILEEEEGGRGQDVPVSAQFVGYGATYATESYEHRPVNTLRHAAQLTGEYIGGSVSRTAESVISSYLAKEDRSK